jgi:hypothetical protein
MESIGIFSPIALRFLPIENAIMLEARGILKLDDEQLRVVWLGI